MEKAMKNPLKLMALATAVGLGTTFATADVVVWGGHRW